MAAVITPSILPPLLGMMATVNAYDVMLTIDRTRAAFHAHRRPPSSPQATTSEATAKGASSAPSAMPNPGVEAWSADRFRRVRSPRADSMAGSIIGLTTASWAMNPAAKPSPTTPMIMLTVAAIVAPRGRDLDALCTSFPSPPLCPPWQDAGCKSTGTRLPCQRCG